MKVLLCQSTLIGVSTFKVLWRKRKYQPRVGPIFKNISRNTAGEWDSRRVA